MVNLMNNLLLDDNAPEWAQLINSAFRGVTSTANAELLKPFLPYRAELTKLPGICCLVNRQYHAIGHSTFTNYEAATGHHIALARVQGLQHSGVVDEGGFLYDDFTAPYRDARHLRTYRAKVEALLNPYMVSLRELSA